MTEEEEERSCCCFRVSGSKRKILALDIKRHASARRHGGFLTLFGTNDSMTTSTT